MANCSSTLALMASLTLAGVCFAPPVHASPRAEPAAYLTERSALDVRDVKAIEQIIARMNHAIDIEDYALYARFYAADGVIDSGFGEPVTGQAAIVASLEKARPLIRNKRHVPGAVVLSGAGNEAVATYYLTVFEREAGLTLAGTALITDTFRKVGERWLVTRHTTRMDPATLRALGQPRG
jgi:ketosteroid isomerase-like protein